MSSGTFVQGLGGAASVGAERLAQLVVHLQGQNDSLRTHGWQMHQESARKTQLLQASELELQVQREENSLLVDENSLLVGDLDFASQAMMPPLQEHREVVGTTRLVVGKHKDRQGEQKYAVQEFGRRGYRFSFWDSEEQAYEALVALRENRDMPPSRKRLMGSGGQFLKRARKVPKRQSSLSSATTSASSLGSSGSCYYQQRQSLCSSQTSGAGSRCESSDSQNECIICEDAEKSHIFTPCGHRCLCKTCATTNRFVECPVCRGPVGSIIQVFDV